MTPAASLQAQRNAGQAGTGSDVQNDISRHNMSIAYAWVRLL
jgi:hypothetical protein